MKRKTILLFLLTLLIPMFFLLSSCFGQIEVEPKIEVTPDSSFRFEMTTTKTGYMVNKFIGTESKVRIPEKYNDKPVIYILSEAFANNDVIEEIVIPNTIIDMWGAVFKGCTNLTKVTIPASVKSIAPITFQDCVGLETINVEKDNPNYRSIDGAVYSKDGKTLIIYPAGKTGEYIIETGVTSIDNYALSYCKKLTKVVLPLGVKKIGPSAFVGCSVLEEMIIPETTVLIDTNAFTGCTSLTEITIPANAKKIENSVFLGCSSLENINVDNNNLNYKSIDGVLYSKDGKDLLTYPAGKTGVEYTVETGTIRLASCSFNDCLNLTKITIPASVEFIGQAIFAGCSNLEVINVDKDNERYKSVDGVVYSKDGTSLDFCPSGKKRRPYN